MCFAPSFSADFVDYPNQDPNAPALLAFDTPSLLSFYYYPDQVNRPTFYVYGGAYWGLTATNTFEHSEHPGSDYVSWATWRVNYQLYLQDDMESSTPWKMSRIRLKLTAPKAGTYVRVSGFSDNINLAVQGVTDNSTTLAVDAYPVDTLFIPQDSNTRFSFWVDYTVMFDPSIPVEEIQDLTSSDSPILPVMDVTGFEPRLVSYVPADSQGSSSAAGQQQIDQSIVAQTQQQQQQYDDFTDSGSGSPIVSIEQSMGETIGFFDAIEQILSDIWAIFDNPAGLATITFPGFSLSVDGVSYQVWPDHVFNFDTMTEEWGLGFLKTAVNFATVVAVYAALLRYLVHSWEAIISRSSRWTINDY